MLKKEIEIVKQGFSIKVISTGEGDSPHLWVFSINGRMLETGEEVTKKQAIKAAVKALKGYMLILKLGLAYKLENIYKDVISELKTIEKEAKK